MLKAYTCVDGTKVTKAHDGPCGNKKRYIYILKEVLTLVRKVKLSKYLFSDKQLQITIFTGFIVHKKFLFKFVKAEMTQE